jgi:hypothetical protein
LHRSRPALVLHVSLRALGALGAVGALGACNVGVFGSGSSSDDSPSDDTPSDDDSSQCGGAGGALPAPYCGEGGCSCCGSCDPSRELCFTDDWSISLGYGHCRSGAVTGSMTATVGATDFAATEVAAIASGAYLQVSGRTGATNATLRQISIHAPATLGTTDCVATPVIAISYAEGETSIRYNAGRSMPRPACSLTLTAIGEIGERIEGTFTVTVLDDATKATFDITAGAFSVERVPYP